MTNFVSNSLKFTKNGFVYIILRDFDEYSVEVEIIDNGSGINKNKYFIFKQFVFDWNRILDI